MPQTQNIALDRDKLRALVHYVCYRAPSPERLGKTKLNKILYYSDIEAYVALGGPITGETYVKHQYGPVSQHIDEVLEELEKERLIAIAEASGYHVYSGQPYMQWQYVSLRRPDISRFKAEEVAIVEEKHRRDLPQPHGPLHQQSLARAGVAERAHRRGAPVLHRLQPLRPRDHA